MPELTVGQQLRAARMGKKLTIPQIAEQTKILGRYLEAIEADDLAALPGGMFYKAWAGQFGAIVGVDLARLRAALASKEIGVPAAPVVTPSPLNTTGSLVTFSGVLGRMAESFGDLLRHDVAKVVLLVAVLGGAGLLFQQWSGRSTVNPGSMADSFPGTANGSRETAGAKVAPVSGELKPQDITSMELPPGTLQFSATDEVWIQIVSNGTTLFAGVMNPGDQKSFNIEQARLKIGNAAGVNVTWKGKPLGQLGNKGEVRVLELTQDRVEFIRPSTAMPDPTPETEG